MNAVSGMLHCITPISQLVTDPFGAEALNIRGHGLCPIPIKLHKKTPLVRYRSLKYPYSPQTVKSLAPKHPSANIGIILDLCDPRLTVVDIDDPAFIQTMITRCGHTPLQVSTPSGGRHLYYRHNGEKQSIRLNGEPVDVKAGRGYVLIPPSHNGLAEYKFFRGSWAELSNLPAATPGVLP